MNRFAAEHTAAVLSLRFSEDGSRLVSGSEDQTARVWDVATGQQLAVLQGHNWWVWDAAFSPDGTQIVTAGQDGIAIVWTDTTPDPKQRWTVPANIRQGAAFTGHNGPVYAASFSPDGKEVVTGGYDRKVLIWKPDEVKPYRWDNLQALTSTVGRLDEENRVAPPAKYRALEGHIASVRAVRFFLRETSGDATLGAGLSESGSTVATGDGEAAGLLVLSSGDDGTVKVWNAATGRAIKTFRGHGSWVRTCAFAPDGQSVLSGSGDGTARQWNIADYAEIRELIGREFTGHGNAVLSASFSFDNRHIVTASQDRTAKTWSDDGRELRTFREGHEFLTSSAVFFPQGDKLLTAAVDNSVRVWNVVRGTETLRLEHTGRSAAVALSADGRWILTGSDRITPDKDALWTAKLWNAETGEMVTELRSDDPDSRAHMAEVTAVAFSPDGKTLFTGDGRGHGHLWRFSAAADGTVTVTKLHELKGHSWGQRIVSARFLADGSRVLTASTDNTVTQWDVKTGRQLGDLMLRHNDSLTAMDVGTDGQRTVVLTACADLSVRLWNADTAKEIGRLQSSGGVAALARNVADILKREGLQQKDLWEMSDLTKEEVGRILNPNSLQRPDNFDGHVGQLARLLGVTESDLLRPYITSVTISPDGRRALTTNAEDRIVRLWDLKTRQEIRIAGGPHQNESFLEGRRVAAVESAIFSPGNRTGLPESGSKADQFVLTVGGSDAHLWDRETGEEQIRYSPHGSVAAAGYSPDGRLIVTAGADSSARIWDAETGTTLFILKGHSLNVNSAVFSPDGTRVLTSSRDRTAILWDTQKGEELFRLSGHTGPVRQAVFSSDGKRIVTASEDGTARIWDSANGEELARLDCQSGPVLCAAFSKDGLRVITGSQGQDTRTGAYAKIWKLSADPDGTFQAKELLYLTGHTAAVTSVAFSPDEAGSRALTGSEDYIVKLWDMRTTDDIARLAEARQPVEAPVPIDFEPAVDAQDPADFFAAGDAGEADAAGPEAAKEILSLAGHNREVTSVAFSFDGHEVLTSGRDGKAILWLTIPWTIDEKTIAAQGANRWSSPADVAVNR